MAGVIIVGAGQGGLQVAASLRDLGFAGPVTLIGDETDLPYQRPPLSKAFLKGTAGEDTLLLKPAAFFAKAAIELVTGTRVTRIDRTRRRVQLLDGTERGYDHLVLATGARNRRLVLPGADLEGVHYLRDWDEARRLKQALPQAKDVAVIGAGFIGLEFAAVARGQGKTVTVLDIASRVMARAIAPATSAYFARRHTSAGIDLRLATAIGRIVGENGRVTGIELADGGRVPADLVVVGIGVVPNCELAEAAGLAIENGIRVDAALQTADPHIFALGDCASFPDVVDGTRVRLESVQNAVDQAKCIAAGIARAPAPYAAVPWFWSDQGDTRLQIAGTATRTDMDVVRGDPAGPTFSVFRFLDGRLRIVESVNAPHDHLAARRLVAKAGGLTPAEAADPAVDLKARALAR